MNTPTTTYQHSDHALLVQRETGCDWDRYAADMEWVGVGIGPVGISRDSDALERSNYILAQEMLDGIDPDAWSIARFNHWAVGWIDEIVYDIGNDDMSAEVSRIRGMLEDYPVLDEVHYSELEWSDNHPDDGVCYSDDGDCPCGYQEQE